MSQMHTKLAATLPEGWKLQPLAQVAQVIDCKHRTPVYTDEGYPVVRPRDVRETGICFEQCLRTSHEEYKDLTEKRQPQPGDIVYSRNATFGVASLVDTQASFAIGQDVCLIVPENVDSRYLYRLLNAPFVKQQLGLVISGSTFKRINLLEIRKLQILLPRLEEQRRIAAILDKADAVRRKRKEAIALTEELLRSAFLEMFGNPVTNPKGWDVVPLGDISKVKGGLQVTPKRKDNPIEVPYLRVANVYRDQLVLDEVKLIRVTPEELERTALCTGDLLIVEGHGNSQEIGRSSVWDGSISNCTHQNHLIRVILDSKRAEPTYISAFLNSSGGRRQLIQFGKTTSGLNTISTSNVKATKVLLPPVSEQKKYADLKQKTAVCLGKHQKHFQNTNNLFNSLLQRAFRGEL